APWFVAVSIKNPEFPRFFFVHEHVDRFLTDVHERVEPWWYFIPCVLLAVLPWVHSVVCSLSSLTLRSIRSRSHSDAWFLAIFAGVVLLFFSASHSKLAPYVLPMMPSIAVLLGPRIASREGGPARAGWVTAVLFTLLGAGLCIWTTCDLHRVPM